MNFKNEAKQVIDTLSDKATMDDAIHALYVASKFDHGESQIRQGKGVSHTKAVRRLEKWLK
jgi:hypothetical protein